MRKMVMGTLLAVAASALLFGSGLSAQATKETGEEIRIFVLDKGGTPVDIKEEDIVSSIHEALQA